MSMTVHSPMQRWRDALDLSEHLLALSSTDRERELTALATTRPSLHSHVLALLGSELAVSNDTYIDPGRAFSEWECRTAGLGPGMRFGAYRLEKQIGFGGMGEVWLARRSDGRFDGLVALKALHAHIAQSSARERFVREGKILGQLSHPHIARLLDAGTTAFGASYLVLEYVEGQPIDRWCEEQKLDIAGRLRLFLQICDAVAHAHARLVIHRDLKPANILVSVRGDIKLLDFGIAKLIESHAPAGETELTRLGGRALTPDFAAPEQILGLPITTATDIYSLGVLLYLLLAGRAPHNRSQMTARQLEEHALESAPPTMARVLNSTNIAAVLAARRLTSSKKLKRVLAGDLNTIVQKALHSEPERRYTSVDQLATDIERHLAGRPVKAAKDTWAYRTHKFLARHVLGTAVLAGSMLTLAAFVLAMYLQMERTARERERAERVSAFLVQFIDQSHPAARTGDPASVIELMKRHARHSAVTAGHSAPQRTASVAPAGSCSCVARQQ